MNRTAGLIGIGALILFAAGCGSSSSQAPPPPQDSGPRMVTDLSKLSSADPLNPFGQSKSPIAPAIPAASDSSAPGEATEAAIGTVRHVGDDKHPSEQRLLNKKAAKFDMLSIRLLDQLSTSVRDLDDQEPIVRMKLPTNLRPVIVTANLNQQGKLREIVIEQHSGVAAVDKMVVKACKQGMYIHNPPADALSGNGDYEVRLEARLQNYSTVDGEHWQFKTYLGLGLL